jgi:hypothetical protein
MSCDTRIVHRSSKMGRLGSARRSTSASEFAFGRRGKARSLALILACAAVWTSPTALTAAAGPRIALAVRVYQTAGLPFTLEQRALAEAEAVLRAGLVEVRWHECTGLNPSPVCSVPPGPSELLLAVRAGDSCHRDTSTPLGAAFVAPRAGGVLATVYVSCVASLATAARADFAVLLGRVAAHELGHLMMRTPAHAYRGLMRPHWTPDEIRRNLPADWAFTAGDVAAMHQPGHVY